MTDNGELLALGTVESFNDLAKRARSKGSELLQIIWKAGETAKKAKEAIGHGGWEQFVETHYEVTPRTVSAWIRFHQSYREADLNELPNLTAALQMAKDKQQPPDGKSEVTSDLETGPYPPPAVEGELLEPVDEGEEEATGTDSPQETTPRPPRNGTDQPGDLGKCPNCAGEKWDQDDFGWVCSKCHHPHGEPAGDVDADRLATQRSKTIKTAEALMRAFDDLHHMCPHDRHENTIVTCKVLIEAAREWK